MSRGKTVLLLSRGMRLHRLFKDMAADLAGEHRVIVLAAPEEVPSFSAVAGVEVHPYRTPEFSPDAGRFPVSIPKLRARVRAVERALGVPLYRAASNYLLYGRIVKSYGGWWRFLETEADILSAYVGAYDQIEEIFDEAGPDLVFFETIDHISSYVAFALAYSRGVFGLEFRFAAVGQGKIWPAFGLRRRNIVLEYLYRQPELILPSSYANADLVMASVGESLASSPYARIHRNMIRGNSLFNPRRIIAALGDAGSLTRAIRNARWHYRSARNRLWLDRILSRDIPDGPYVVFFMQHLPEASTCSQAPRWVYQDAIVEQLAVNGPSHLKILVKEHPRSYGRRGRSFFGPLRELPNVVLCHPSVPNDRLLARAEAVLVITGTAGFEALLFGKRVGVLGRPFYAVYEGVRPLNYPEEIYSAMGDPAWRPEEMVQERRRFLAAYIQSLHDFGHGEGTRVYPPSAGDKWARAIRATMQFIETHKLTPRDFDTGL